MVTYKRIADMAGVSESTVSKALSGSSEVSFSTGEKIKKIACELGYYSDKRKLRRDYTRDFKPNVAIICPEITSVFYSNKAESLVERITKTGGNATVMITGFDRAVAGSMAESVACNPDFDGIFSDISFYTDSKLNIPIVFLSSFPSVQGYDKVFCDYAQDVELLVEYLLSKGHRTLGFCGELLTISKESIFREIMKKHSVPVAEEYVVRVPQRFFKAGKEAFSEYERRGVCMPDAIVFAYDEIAFGFMDEARRHGVRIPEDVSVVSINNTHFSGVSNPPLTSVANWHVNCADKAYELLISRILGSDAPARSYSFNSIVVERESVLNKI